ncbi:hypothetical protein [Candidatus Frankia nodulisporulans]|uniref:hypothetical protein n=1 Tax=Candidatus Frankia nodulisporulans TaxID=2060052 RepID=UPI00370398C6
MSTTGFSSWDCGFRRGLLPRSHSIPHRGGRIATRACMGGEAHRERTARIAIPGPLPDPVPTTNPAPSDPRTTDPRTTDPRTTGQHTTGQHTAVRAAAGALLYWRRPACAPGLRFTCRDNTVIIRYRYAGRTCELRMPHGLWSQFVDDVRRGRFDLLAVADGENGWTSWSLGHGQVARGLPDEVIIRVGARQDEQRERRLPTTIWELILVAVRAHAIDNLDAPTPVRPGDHRPSGFLLLHGSALRPTTRPRTDGQDRQPGD